jgi:hypothetical protein
MAPWPLFRCSVELMLQGGKDIYLVFVLSEVLSVEC